MKSADLSVLTYTAVANRYKMTRHVGGLNSLGSACICNRLLCIWLIHSLSRHE